MDYEYLEGVLMPGPNPSTHSRVKIVGVLSAEQNQPTLEQLGAQRWQMCGCVGLVGAIHVFFCRQKLYAVQYHSGE